MFISKSRPTDFIVWAKSNEVKLKYIRQLRYKESKGIIHYLRDAKNFFSNNDDSSNKNISTDNQSSEKSIVLSKVNSQETSDKEKISTSDTALSNYFAALPLLKKMKWKRLTFDKDANFDAFYRNINACDDLFSKIPAFSFLSLHLVKDNQISIRSFPTNTDEYVHFTPGCLTKSFWDDTDQIIDTNKSTEYKNNSAYIFKNPYSIDWVSGEVHILDSISPIELKYFLLNSASQIQATQQRMENEQNQLTEDIENVRIRLGATAIKFNDYDRTFWDDPKRKTNPNEYVTPKEVNLFCANVFKQASLLRFYTGGHEIRIIKSNLPYTYNIDKREINIPANFSEFNYLYLHHRWLMIETFLNKCRIVWWLWFGIILTIIGDISI